MHKDFIYRKFLPFGAAAAICAAAPPSHAAAFWDTSRSIVAGTGCHKNIDAFELSSGDEYSVVFTTLGVDMVGGVGPALSGYSNCAVRVPVQIAKGLYIGQLTQTATYGIVKTPGSQGSLSTTSTFFNNNVSPLSYFFNYGSSLNVSQHSDTRVDYFAVNTPWWQGWCNPNRALEGIYQANFAVSGKRTSINEALEMFVNGLDLKYTIVVAAYIC